MSALSDLMGVLLPTGVAGALILFTQAVKSWRDGRQTREETVLERWQRFAREAEDEQSIAEHNAEYAKEVAYFWQMRSADLEFLIRANQLELPPMRPYPAKTAPPKRRRNDTMVRGRTRQNINSREAEEEDSM